MLDAVALFNQVTFYAKLNIAASVLNMLTTALLIYGTLMVRKGTRINIEWSKSLEEWQRHLSAASGIETRSAIDPQGRGPKGESPTA